MLLTWFDHHDGHVIYIFCWWQCIETLHCCYLRLHMLACQERQILGYINFGMTLWLFIWGFNRLHIVLNKFRPFEPNLSPHNFSYVEFKSKQQQGTSNCTELRSSIRLFSRYSTSWGSSLNGRQNTVPSRVRLSPNCMKTKWHGPTQRMQQFGLNIDFVSLDCKIEGNRTLFFSLSQQE